MSSKTELVARIAEEQNLSLAKARRVVDSVVENIGSIVSEHGSLTLRGFGRFELRTRAARIVRSGVTGSDSKEFAVPARTTLAFKASPDQRR